MLPVVIEGFDFNPITETRDGPVVEVEAARVVKRYTVRAKNAGEIAAMKAAKSAALEAEYQRRWQLPITHTVGGAAREFHGDQEAVENISGIVLLIVAGLPVPNPRPWTPKDQASPVNVTHAELIGLGAAIAARKDALFAKKKIAQAAVAALTAPAAVDAYDVTDCWA
jgi:hypothetical protein